MVEPRRNPSSSTRWRWGYNTMPGNVAVATPTTVLPKRLGGTFRESHEYITEECGPYMDGAVQQTIHTPSAPRRSWDVAEQLSATLTAALHAFYLARKGPLTAFYFYPNPDDWDSDGSSETGRYTVRFDGPMSADHAMSEVHTTSYRVVEVV